MIKHLDTIQYFKIIKEPITEMLSSFVNLKRLELENTSFIQWNCLENLTLPFLQVLNARRIPVKMLTSLIENTNGHLTEIKIERIFHEDTDNQMLIQAIYQRCV